MNLKLKRTPGIYIVGFMGSGKSTVGRLLADEIGWRFADLDEDIEREQQQSVPELFATLGEEGFRKIESQAIARRIQTIKRGLPTVLALGGGAFTREENRKLLTDNGITVWIDTDFAVIKKRVEGSSHRPLARDPKRFEQLYYERLPLYTQAEYRVQVLEDNSRSAVTKILELPFWQER